MMIVDPALMTGLGERELSGTFRNEPTLVQLYRALGFRVLPYADRDQPHGSSKQSSDYVKLSVRPHLLDLAKMQRVVTALYAFRSLPPDTTARPSEEKEEEEWGYVPIRGEGTGGQTAGGVRRVKRPVGGPTLWAVVSPDVSPPCSRALVLFGSAACVLMVLAAAWQAGRTCGTAGGCRTV